MKKLKYYFKLLKNMDIGKMFNIIDKIHKRSGKSKISIFIDMIVCSIKYTAGYMDYYVFNFEELTSAERKTYITRGVNNDYIKYTNDPNYYYIFKNKIKFNEVFREFIKRDYLYLDGSNFELFENFIKKHNVFMAKVIDAECGKGIKKVLVTEKTNHKRLYNNLVKNKQVLIEEYIKQNKKMNELYPVSVNTLRIVTLLKRGKPIVLFKAVRIGNKGNSVDNFNHGGMFSVINDEGIINKPAIDKNDNVYYKHPLTKCDIVGFKIPYYEEAIQLALEASKKVKQVRMVGFDIAITDKGPVLIEGNELPGYDIYQSKCHLDSKIGLKPYFDKKIYGIKK